MANSTLGQLAPFLLTPATATKVPFTTPQQAALLPARYAGTLFGAPGTKTLSGRAYESSAPAIRRIIILTQPPAPVVIYEALTTLVAGTFAFPYLPAGNYLVLDCMTDNSRQALVYDWVVVP